MTVLISKSVRIIILVAALVSAAILSWSSIRAALADYYSGLGTLNGYEKAAHLEPTNARYWYLLGQYFQVNLEQPDVNRAIESYRVSLSLDSQSAATWLGLASAYEEEDDIPDSRAAFLEAKHFYPNSPDVALRYGNFLFRQNELTAGLLEIRHAVEADQTRGLEAFLLCRHFEPNLDLILARALPPATSIYLDLIWQLTAEGDTDNALKVWSRLVALRPRLTTREVFHFVGGLLNKQQMSEAQRVWGQAVALMELPKMEDPPGSLIWDGGFETNVVGGGLAWRIEPYKPVTISYDQKIRHSGNRALRIDIRENNYSDLVGVCQGVVVEPNTTYEFSAWLRTRDLAHGGGIFFRVTTPGIEGSQVATTPTLGGTNEWTKVSISWTSSAHSHRSEVCLSRSSDGNQLPGTVWVDDVSLLRIDTATK